MRIEDTNCVNYYAEVTMETDCTTASGYLEVLDAFERCFGCINGNTPCEFQSLKTVSSRPDILTLGGDVYLTRYYVYSNDDKAMTSVKYWLSLIVRVLEKATRGTDYISVEEVEKCIAGFRGIDDSSDLQAPFKDIIDTSLEDASLEMEHTKQYDFAVEVAAIGLMNTLAYHNLSFEGSKYTSFYNLADVAVIPLRK